MAVSSNIVLQGVAARSLEAAPELRSPPPLSPSEVDRYRESLGAMSFARLLQEVDVMTKTYDQIEPALPDFRLSLDLYPHPVVQRRLLALNELYRRAASNPVENYTYRKRSSMLEWGAAGAIIGGVVGYVGKDSLWLGAAVGAVLGSVAGRSELLKDVLTGLSSRVLMM